MAVKTADISITPYTSTVPLVNIPPQAMDQQTRPAQPLQGQFGKPGTGALAIGDSIIKGFLLGHQEKEARKNAQATATINAADKATQDAYSQYQDALSTNKDKASQDAAYQQYVKTFNQAKEAKAQYVIPEKPAKGQPKGKDGKKQLPGMGGIKEFFEANPHIIPQIALMTMQPKPPGLSAEAQQAQLKQKETQTNIQLGEARLAGEQTKQQQEQRQQQVTQQNQWVEEHGGADAVLADPKSTEDQKQAASRVKYTALDKMSPAGRMKYDLEQKLLGQIGTGPDAVKDLTSEQRVMAGNFGILPKVQTKTETGRNGNKYEIQYDPLTNQPVRGTEPLNLGPPAWEQEFYAKRAIEKNDLRKDVEENPDQYGIKLTGDPKTDRATVDATVDHRFTMKENGIRSLANTNGSTGFEAQRDNAWLTDVNNRLHKMFTGSSGPVQFDWTGGQKVNLTAPQMHSIMGEFIESPADTPGVYGFRSTVAVPPGMNGKPKDAGALERDRKWVYNLVKNTMMTQKGKNALTSAQADAILKNTSLGQPIGPMEKPPQQTARGGMEQPPTQGKLYTIPGYSEPAYLTDEQVKLAAKNHIPIQEVDPSLLQQFSQ